jgi:biopolymer transport protein ExbB
MKYLMRSLKLVCVTFFVAITFLSQANEKMNTSLLNDIKQAKTSLQKTEQTINNEKNKLHKKLENLQDSVLLLRDKTAVARRASDEKTLSLQQLEQRLSSWQQQNKYQKNLLSRFVQDEANYVGQQGLSYSELLHKVTEFTDHSIHQLQPQWERGKIAFNNGEIKEINQLTIGPLNWFVDEANNQAGLIDISTAQPMVALSFSDELSQGLLTLLKENKGSVPFDPTLTRAIAKDTQKESITEHINKGGLWALPILMFGFIAVIIAIVKSIQLVRLPKLYVALAERLQRVWQETHSTTASVDNVNAIQQKYINIVKKYPLGQQRDDALFGALLNQKQTLENWLGVIAITAAIAPLLGLLGTVSGMIETFKLMTIFGAGDPSAVSGGISEALVTTELGLVVAIPSLLLHALLSRKVKSYYGQLEQSVVELSQITHSEKITELECTTSQEQRGAA